MKYILMMNAPRDGWEAFAGWPHEDLVAHVGFMKRLGKELSDTGELVAAEGLAMPATARIVRAGKGGAPEVTDGPFPETKEFLAGYWIVEVDNVERAYAIAARASGAPGRGGAPMSIPIEVREVMSGPPVEAP